MKYKILANLLLALLLQGCTKTDSVEEVVQMPISFDASVGKQTRYIVEGTAYPTSVHFGVWAFLKKQGASAYDYVTPFMDDVEMKKLTNGWASRYDYYYWPVYGKLKFVAYSPYTIGTPTYTAADGLMFTDVTPYEGDDTWGYDDIDFMYTEDASATDKTRVDAPVGLTFKHALTQVRFTAATSMSGVAFHIKELKLGHILDVGTFKTLPTPGWSNLKTDNTDLSWFIMFKGDSLVTHTEQQVGFSVLYIPQPVADMEVRIKYTVTNHGVTELVSKSIPLSGQPWVMNQKVKYTLNFSANEITFTPSVGDWTSEAAELPLSN